MKILPLGSFCQTGSGGTPNRSKLREYYDNGTIPWIKSGELTRSLVDSTEEFITESGLNESSAKFLEPGAILVAMYGATVGQVSRLGIPAATNQAICHIYPDQKICDTNYLYRFLQGTRYQLLAQRVGGGQPNISQTIIRNLQIPLPPLAEQKRIAAILDATDALRSKRREAIALLDALLQSTFLDIFGDPVTNPMGWKQIQLGEIAEKITDGEHLNPEFSNSGMPMVMAGNILENGVDIENAKYVEKSLGVKFRRKCDPEKNDILLVSRGATIGRLCVVDTERPFCLMGSVIQIKLLKNLTNAAYLSELLKHPAMRRVLYRTSGSSAQQAIYIKDVRKLDCMVPPLDLQHRFAAIVESVERQKALQHAHLVELDTLFASLQQRAFNGEL